MDASNDPPSGATSTASSTTPAPSPPDPMPSSPPDPTTPTKKATDDAGPAPQPQTGLEELKRHRSALPLFLYPLSFCDPLPSPLRSPRAFLAHPGVLYFIGVVSALLAGLAIPALDLLYGRVWTAKLAQPGVTPEEIINVSSYVGWLSTVIGVACGIFSILFLATMSIASRKLTIRMRHAYVASVLSQDITYFDQHGAGEVAGYSGKDIGLIRAAFGEKFGYLVWNFSTMLAAFSIGFATQARVIATLLPTIPFVLGMFALVGVVTDRVGGPALKLEGRISSFLESALGSVRVVQAFNIQGRLLSRLDGSMLQRLSSYDRSLALARGTGGSGALYFALNASYALAFYVIGQFIVRYNASLGPSLTSFWNTINALFALASLVPHVSAIATAMASMKAIRRAIEREPRIDVRQVHRGLRPHGAPASLELRDVTMAYPSRPGVAVLRSASLEVPAAKVTAIVGPSGSGKSSVISLFLREIDPATANELHASDAAEEAEEKAAALKIEAQSRPRESWWARVMRRATRADAEHDEADQKDSAEKPRATMGDTSTDGEEKMERVRGSGTVLFAGIDVRDLNLRWLRAHVAVVNQNPMIFSATILENVAEGLVGTDMFAELGQEDSMGQNEALRARVKTALEKAQAWGFVSKLHDGMDTHVNGGRTGLLSGGQRQRIALARALIRQPKVLILDEATSALDSRTEARITQVLAQEQRERGMTVVIIAHRLSTVRRADKIVVLKAGRVRDVGTHEELIEPGRGDQTYRKMVLTQRALADVEDDDGSAAQDHDGQQDGGADEEPFSDETTVQVAGSVAASAAPPGQRAPTSPGSGPVPPSARLTRKASDMSKWQLTGRGPSVGQGEHIAGPSMSNTAGANTLGPRGTDLEQAGAEDSASGQRGKKKPRLLRHFLLSTRPMAWSFAIGVIGGIIGASNAPIAGWMTGRAVDALANPDESALVRDSKFWALWFFILAVLSGIVISVQSSLLEFAAQRLVRVLKVRAFVSLMRQEVGFFDDPKLASGSLTSGVNSHPANIGSAMGLTLSQIVLSVFNLVGSIILGLAINWKAGIITIFPPVAFILVAGWANTRYIEEYELSLQGPEGEAASYIAESVDAIKEIVALGLEYSRLKRFDRRAQTADRMIKSDRYLFIGSVGFGLCQAVVLLDCGLLFWYGGKLLARGELDIKGLYALIEASIIGVFVAGRTLSFGGDIGRAIASFRALNDWFERKPRIATLPGKVPEDDDFARGDIVFSSVEMRYPQRPTHAALSGLDLVIPAGRSVCFCGPSGGGKSSIFQLLERFYDPCLGTIRIGAVDVRALPPEELRRHVAIVTQDPVLFDGSVRWNLALGSDNPDTVTDAEIEAACEKAMILDFVKGLPEGFETNCGLKGAEMSGGQRQRLCIARALVRDPKILLLDEATSALDSESEKMVQEALDKAAQGRTTVTIAHRLSTIRNADVIHVLEDGKIVESGTHRELLRARGRYRELVEAQL